MAILQLREHHSHELKEGIVIHVGCDAGTILPVYRIPIDLLVFEETIISVQYCPESIEIGSRVTGHLPAHIVTTRQKEKGQQQK